MALEKIMIIVGKGVVRKAPVVFSSVGLGSCVVVTLYDAKRHIGGFAHILLPGNRQRTTTLPLSTARERETKNERRKKGMRYEDALPQVPSIVLTTLSGGRPRDSASAGEHMFLDETYHYTDTAIAALLAEMTRQGASLRDIAAKIAGGAKMFADGEHYEASIGGRNVKSVKQLLKKEKIPILGEDTGGDYGRNVDFHLDSGRVVVSTIGGMKKEI